MVCGEGKGVVIVNSPSALCVPKSGRIYNTYSTVAMACGNTSWANQVEYNNTYTTVAMIYHR